MNRQLSLVIFGITSNLAQLKLIPALYDLEKNNLLPAEFKIIGIARKSFTPQEFTSYIHHTLHLVNRHHRHEINEHIFHKLYQRFRYLQGDLNDPELYHQLNRQLIDDNLIFYLATYPDLYAPVFHHLHKSELHHQTHRWVRVVIEKPIGSDLATAKLLNKLLLTYFSEDQLYRLDHYLGKETLQNILNFRFGNGIFEPLITTRYIDHIQITAAENFGIGQRGGYYDNVGALKDVGQNHILQMLALTTMEDPEHFSNQAVTNARIKVLKQLQPLPDHLILGQYQNYHQEPNVRQHSQTDTFFAFKTFLRNIRFRHVPIYVRAGKHLAQDVTEISIIFKLPVNRLFKEIDCGNEPNILIYRIQPHEGIILKILAKAPGHEHKIVPTYMQFCYQQLPGELTDPYERLLMDVIKGDQTFFNDAPEIEAQWRFIDPLSKSRKQPITYKPGTWGPKEADNIINTDGRSWLEPSPEFCQL